MLEFTFATTFVFLCSHCSLWQWRWHILLASLTNDSIFNNVPHWFEDRFWFLKMTQDFSIFINTLTGNDSENSTSPVYYVVCWPVTSLKVKMQIAFLMPQSHFLSPASSSIRCSCFILFPYFFAPKTLTTSLGLQTPLPQLSPFSCSLKSPEQEQRFWRGYFSGSYSVSIWSAWGLLLKALWKEDVVTGQGPATQMQQTGSGLSVIHLWHNLLRVGFCVVASVSVWLKSVCSRSTVNLDHGKILPLFSIFTRILNLLKEVNVTEDVFDD